MIVVPLKTVCHIRHGGTPSKANPAYWNGAIPWVSPKDMKSSTLHDSSDHITQDAVENSATSVVPEKSILVVVRSGILAHSLPIAQVLRPLAFNQDIKSLTPDSGKVDPDYLFWYVRAQEPFVLSQGVKKGATVHSLQSGFIENLQVPLPEREDQRRIVDLLSRAEGIVLLRREAEKKAAELIPALFLILFGDPATNPKGWPVAMLPDVLDRPFKNGLYLPKEKYSNDGVEMVHMSDAFYGEVKRGGLRRVLADDKQIRDYGLSKNDLLVARRSLTFDGAAKLCGIPSSDEPLLFESSFIRLTPDLEKVRTEYLLYYLNNESTRKAHVLSRISGITISGINQAALSQIPVMIPSPPKQDSFVELVGAVRSIQSQQAAATAKAKAAFDALLAQVFSGGRTMS